MGKIAHQIELFNAALRLASAEIAARRASLAGAAVDFSSLGNRIQSLIKAGAVDPQEIAKAAVSQFTGAPDG